MFKKLDQFKCFVRLEDGKLYKCDMTPDGSIEMAFGQISWNEIKPPVTQAFLDAVNQAFGTDYKSEQFSKNDTKKRSP